MIYTILTAGSPTPAARLPRTPLGRQHHEHTTDSLTISVGLAACRGHGASAGRADFYPPPPALAQSPPGTPSSVSITRADGSLTASWPAVSNATAYHVTYSVDGGRSWSLAALRHAGTSIDIGAKNSATYIVGVRAGNGYGWGGWRNSPSSGPFTPPTPPKPPGPVSSRLHHPRRRHGHRILVSPGPRDELSRHLQLRLRIKLVPRGTQPHRHQHRHQREEQRDLHRRRAGAQLGGRQRLGQLPRRRPLYPTDTHTHATRRGHRAHRNRGQRQRDSGLGTTPRTRPSPATNTTSTTTTPPPATSPAGAPGRSFPAPAPPQRPTPSPTSPTAESTATTCAR